MNVKGKVKWKRGIRCHNCGKLEHIQKDCYERGERKSEKSRKSQQRYTAKKKNEDSTHIGLLALAHALADDSDSQRNNWIIDSGATCHICCNKTMFDKMEDMDTPQVVTLGDGRSIETHKQGTVKLKLKQSDGSYRSGTFHDVLYVPELLYNLLSIAKATSLGKIVRFDESTCKIFNKAKEVIGVSTKIWKSLLPKLPGKHSTANYQCNTVKNHSRIMIWHHRYGHLNVTSLRKLANEQLVKGLSCSDVSDEMALCESCVQGKIH